MFQRRSLLVYLCRFCWQRKVKTFSSRGAHFRSGDNIFSVQIATTTADHLTFQVFERGLDSEPVGGEILFGVGGG